MENDKPVIYMLSKVIDRNSGTAVNLKRILKKYYSIHPDAIQPGETLRFKDVDHIWGFHTEGEIISVEKMVYRKRDYVVVSTKIRDYYLLVYRRNS